MKAYKGLELQPKSFLNLGPYGGDWLAKRPGRFNPYETAVETH
jgi:hypothetical protein